jgi:hypothetical protein
MSSDGQPLRTEKLTLQTILQLGYAAYERTHALPASVRRAVWAILACRTASWVDTSKRVPMAMGNGSGTIIRSACGGPLPVTRARPARRHGVSRPAACLASSPPPRRRNACEAGGDPVTSAAQGVQSRRCCGKIAFEFPIRAMQEVWTCAPHESSDRCPSTVRVNRQAASRLVVTPQMRSTQR